jgi:hypothetical protein
MKQLDLFPMTESEMRDLVGAPSIQEEETCACGASLELCPDNYEHMTHGV